MECIIKASAMSFLNKTILLGCKIYEKETKAKKNRDGFFMSKKSTTRNENSSSVPYKHD